MSYQVLARSWRPRSFHALEGQEHVLKALINALDNQRLHHAYLFTGTRGVGKTTIARILAKCLNCETGITSKPCGQCDSCLEIDEGRFIDLIEVDAASRTKVEDTRELLNNVQYAPTRGRFKIYLIDEVHMLSGHSFNALLKTLEEPPPHVKFLLATTDPQKLPMTVLSRCLQFNLKNLSAERIASYIEEKLKSEKIPYENAAILQIGKVANGSMRDALSLLDQAISFSNNHVTTHEVSQMLGTIEKTHIESIIKALFAKDGKGLMTISNALSEQGADFNGVLEELISMLHQMTVAQIVSEAVSDAKILELSRLISSEEIQLYYQIALTGRKDLPYATDAKSGFEMTLLRMLAFHPMNGSEKKTAKIEIESTQKQQSAVIVTDFQWGTLISELKLTGMLHSLATNCVLKSFDGHVMELRLNENHAALLNDKIKTRLNEILNQHFNKNIRLNIKVDRVIEETPAKKKERLQGERHKKAIFDIENDENVKTILNQFGTTIDPGLTKSS